MANNAQLAQAASTVLVTTGDIQAKYQPVRIVFAIGGSQSGLFRTANPQEAFEKATEALKMAAAQLGGHAVVHCAFGYHPYANSGCGGGLNFVVHGYGTVVTLV